MSARSEAPAPGALPLAWASYETLVAELGDPFAPEVRTGPLPVPYRAPTAGDPGTGTGPGVTPPPFPGGEEER